MSKMTIALGGTLIVLGIAAYFATGGASVTALIPAFFGAPILVLGVVGLLNEGIRKHAMHGAVALAFLGFLGTVGAVRFALYMVSVGPQHIDNPPAVIVRTLMAILCGVYLYFGIRSFVEARKGKKNG